MNCINCGQAIAEGRTSCLNCGRPVPPSVLAYHKAHPEQTGGRHEKKTPVVSRFFSVLFGVFKAITYRIKRFVMRFMEYFVVLGIVTGFYLIFLILLFSLFSTGQSGSLWVQRALFEIPSSFGSTGSERTERNMKLSSPFGESVDLETNEEVAAHLTFRKNDVRIREAGEIYWTGARMEMSLHDRDAIQTLKKSRAIITFDESNYLDVDEQSMVIIKKIESNPMLRERRSFLVMVDGNLRGRIEASPDRNTRIEVATGAGIAHISATQASQNKADFSLKINPDKSTSLTVFEGEATISAMGKTVVVQKNETAQVRTDEAPSDPTPIPEAVTLQSPTPESFFYYRDFPKQIHLSWNRDSSHKKYHLQIARDPQFRDRILDEVTAQNTFMYGNLRSGNYHWRVSAVTEAGIEGSPGEARPLGVVQDSTPPRLTLHSPAGSGAVLTREILIKGLTEADARVFVNSRAVRVGPDGAFSLKARLRDGVNVVVVLAIDAAGNTAYETRTLTRKR
ncbi:MAG TPA: hypothetical protein VI702_00905 [Nitrospiria bacterium]